MMHGEFLTFGNFFLSTMCYFCNLLVVIIYQIPKQKFGTKSPGVSNFTNKLTGMNRILC